MTTPLTPEIIKEALDQAPGLLEKFYDDLLSPSAKEVGFVLRHITRTFGLLSYPFMHGSALYEKICGRVFNIAEQVPENVRVMPAPQLFLEYLDKTKYIPDSSLLIKSYNALLSSALNKERRNLVHPAFITILSQLSVDEITIIKNLYYQNYIFKRRSHLDSQQKKFFKHEVIENEFPLSEIYLKEHFMMYCEHLEKLDLLTWPLTHTDYEYDSNKKQTGIVSTFTLGLSEFGRLFAEVCCK